MSLVVSLRVPDGIVVCADSLSTARTNVQMVLEDLQIKCPECGSSIEKDRLKLPAVPIPFSASSFTQKLVPLFEQYSIASCGLGIIYGRSAMYHLRLLEMEHQENIPKLEELTDKLVSYFESQLESQFPGYKEKAPEDWFPIGFHLNGYEDQHPRTYEIFVGKKSIIRKHELIGCTIGGDMTVVQKLWEIGKKDSGLQFKYGLLSLQDAVDLGTYLIETTSSFQRFANVVPTVGGAVDVALVTPFDGFRWISEKSLSTMVQRREER